jgi:hypothetical protein
MRSAIRWILVEVVPVAIGVLIASVAWDAIERAIQGSTGL